MTLLLLGNEPMNYAWGSDHLIQDLTGLGVEGEPAAELWFGAHKTAPSKILSGGEGLLSDLHPALGFLVKFLAALKPLSIQAHPSKARAQRQFALGHKSYSDANHKPEMIIAVTDFEALCGFRPETEIESDLAALAATSVEFGQLQQSFVTGGLEAAVAKAFEKNLANELHANLGALSRSRVQLYLSLAEHFEGDVGLVIGTLFLNHIRLAPKEALYLPAGNIHAYLKGLGVEVMASSDNVLRGGLTPKPIDVPELMAVLDFSPLANPRVDTKELVNGLVAYPADVEDFSVYGVEVASHNMLIDLELKGSMILVCVSGELEVSTSKDEFLKVSKGQACFVSDARLFSITGSGSGYLAMG